MDSGTLSSLKTLNLAVNTEGCMNKRDIQALLKHVVEKKWLLLNVIIIIFLVCTAN